MPGKFRCQLRSVAKSATLKCIRNTNESLPPGACSVFGFALAKELGWWSSFAGERLRVGVNLEMEISGWLEKLSLGCAFAYVSFGALNRGY